ncbi:MAG: glycosyltransferase family 4 protein [Raoultibacter sp.]
MDPRSGFTADRVVRVALFVSSLQDMGGAIRAAVLLSNRLCDDFHVTLIELERHDYQVFSLDERVEVVSLNVSAPRLRQRITEAFSPLSRCLSDRHIEVLLGVGLDETVAAIGPCKKTRTKLIFCDHGALVNQMDDKLTTLLRAVCAIGCQKTVVLTQQTKEDYHRIFRVNSKKIIRIPNWIPRALLENARTYDVASKKILWAGRLDKEKGIDLLFEVARRVLTEFDDWTWDVYGEVVLNTGDFNLEHEIERAGLQERFRLLGRVDDLYERYAAYAIGTLTSYREGLPLFLLEGKACGLPLISFDVNTGPRDIIVDGVDGFLIPPYDCDAYAQKLRLLMGDCALRQEMSEATRDAVDVFSEDAVYALWFGLIRETAL